MSRKMTIEFLFIEKKTYLLATHKASQIVHKNPHVSSCSYINNFITFPVTLIFCV